jgi:hypothetical protein
MKTNSCKSIGLFSTVFLILFGLLIKPIASSFKVVEENFTVALEIDWNNDADEKEDIEEKDKINTSLVFGESKNKIHNSFSNFDSQEKISFSIYLQIIKPPPEKA